MTIDRPEKEKVERYDTMERLRGPDAYADITKTQAARVRLDLTD